MVTLQSLQGLISDVTDYLTDGEARCSTGAIY